MVQFLPSKASGLSYKCLNIHSGLFHRQDLECGRQKAESNSLAIKRKLLNTKGTTTRRDESEVLIYNIVWKEMKQCLKKEY